MGLGLGARSPGNNLMPRGQQSLAEATPCDLVGDKQPLVTEPAAFPDSLPICFTLKKILILGGFHRCLPILLMLLYILKIVPELPKHIFVLSVGVFPPLPLLLTDVTQRPLLANPKSAHTPRVCDTESCSTPQGERGAGAVAGRGGRIPRDPLVSTPLDAVPVESGSVLQPSEPLPQKATEAFLCRRREPPLAESRTHRQSVYVTACSECRAN